MKTIHVSRKSKSLFAVLEAARKEQLLIKTPDGSEFTLSLRDEADNEIAAIRNNKQLKAYLQECARHPRTIPHAKVKQMFGLK